MDSPWPQAHPCYWWTILFMRPTFNYFTGMARGALRRIAAHFVLGFPTHNPTHKKYVLYDFRVLWQSPRSSKFDTVEVWGSSPHGPTIQNKDLAQIPKKHSGVQKDTLLRPICVLLPDASLLSTELGHVLCRVGNG